MLMIAGMLTVLALAVFLMLRAFEENIVYFVTPSDLQDRVLTGEEQFRLGGLVEDGTVLREQGTLKVTFLVTDGGASTLVVFEGILPDLFREGQGGVVEEESQGAPGGAQGRGLCPENCACRSPVRVLRGRSDEDIPGISQDRNGFLGHRSSHRLLQHAGLQSGRRNRSGSLL